MKTPTTHLLGSLTGAVGAGLTFGGLMLANAATADLNPDQAATSIAAVFATKREDIRLGVSLALAGVLVLIFFVAYLSGRVKAASENEWLGSAVLAGGMIALTGVLIHLAVLVAATNSAIVLAPEAAQTFLVLEWEYGGVLAPAFAALVGGASVAVVRSRLGGLLSRLVGWIGVLLALGLAFSGFMGGALVVLAMIWLFLLALSLFVEAIADRLAFRRPSVA